jgi:two-component system sensor kinase FixL
MSVKRLFETMTEAEAFIRDLTERQETEARFQELQGELIHMSRLTALGEMSSALGSALG